MFRTLILLLAAWLAIHLIRQWLRRPAPPPESGAGDEKMVQCHHCGLYVPRGEAITSGTDFYCCDAHRREHDEREP